MYFLLRKNSLGALNICGEGICRFLQKVLQQHDLESVLCRSFCIPNNSGEGLLVLNKRDDNAEKIILESMSVIGIKTDFICAFDGASGVNFAYKVKLSLCSPWFWSSLTTVAALLFFVGLPGLFWISFWGAAGWFSSRFIMSRQVLSWISSWRSSIAKN